MVDELSDSIINSPAHQQTLVKNLLTKLKVRNKLIHDRVSQSKPTNMQQFIHHLLRIGSDAIRINQEYAQLQASSMASIQAPRSAPGTPILKKQKTSAASNNRYESQGSGNATSTAIQTPCNGCGIPTTNSETHNWGNCGRRTDPEFNNEEHTAYAQSTAGRAATARRALLGQPPLPTIDKTFGTTPYNNAAATGNASGGGCGGRGRDNQGGRGTYCDPCSDTLTNYLSSLSTQSDSDLIRLLFKV